MDPNKVLSTIVEIMNNALNGNSVLTESNYDDELALLGMDSILFIQIVVTFEETFEIEIPDDKLLIAEMGTIHKMADVITSVLVAKIGEAV